MYNARIGNAVCRVNILAKKFLTDFYGVRII